MAVSVFKKRSRETKKSKLSKVAEVRDDAYIPITRRIIYRIPGAILLLMLVFLWSSSTTVLSGSFFHVCVSSRKLNNLYCLSAGSQPNNVNGVSIPLINKNNETITTSNENSLGEERNIVEEIQQVIEGTHQALSVPDLIELSASSTNITTTTTTTTSGTNTDTANETENEIVKAIKEVKEQLRVHRSWSLNSTNDGVTCDGRGIFVYDLPSKFNKDLMEQCGDMVPWMNFCDFLTNEAKGEPLQKLGNGWYGTHQYSLEPIFHSRVLKHPCRVYNENEAKLFYVPYYGGLDILRWHFKKNVTFEMKDELGVNLMDWLGMQRSWERNSGKDHVFVLGKISWDFRRASGYTWGTRFLDLEAMQNPVKLLIERQPWRINDIGVPHPTHFHPHSDEDIIEWQTKLILSSRKNLVSFAGAARPGAPENIRSLLIKQCTSRDDGKCKFLDCNSGVCSKPESVIELFMESEFCMQPPGDSPTRKSVFDSLLSGCIPVLFDPFTAYYQYPWHLPEDYERYSVFVDKEEVRNIKVDVVEKLMKVSKRERDEMRRYIIYELLPGLIYGDSSSQFVKFRDAFTISMDNLLNRVSRLNLSSIA